METYKTSALPGDYVSRQVFRFRLVTAAIVIAFFGSIADEDFRKSRHAIRFDLWSPWWLNTMCHIIDEARATGITYSKLVMAISVIHCATSDALFDDEDDIGIDRSFEVVAWREGALSVLPNILFKPAISISCLDIRLTDKFWANVTPGADGQIKTGRTPYGQGEPLPRNAIDNPNCDISIGRPRHEAPDTAIEIEFGRPLHYGVPALSLVGHVDGKALGSCGILEILLVLVSTKDLGPDFPCPGHETSTLPDYDDGSTENCGVLVAKTSVWRDLAPTTAPIILGRCTYVPVQNDEHWALFLLSFNRDLHALARIGRGCIRRVQLGGDLGQKCTLWIGLRNNDREQEMTSSEEHQQMTT